MTGMDDLTDREALEDDRMSEPQMTVWAVVYSNYEPAEIDSLWATEELAKRREEELDAQPDSSGGWHVVPWSVGIE